MKIRSSHVTNSSSSSYTCDICNENFSGWDLSLEECEMFRCEHDHFFCQGHVDIPEGQIVISHLENLIASIEANEKHSTWRKENLEQYKEDIEKIRKNGDGEEVESFPDYYSDALYDEGISSKLCPLCNFEDMSDQDLIRYLLLTLGKTRRETVKQAKVIYGTVDKLYEVWNVKQKEKKE